MGCLSLDLLESDIDSLQELLVNASIFLDRVIVKNNVRIDSIVLDNPFPGLRIEARGTRNPDICTVKIR